jgi:hypothetical protein
MPGDCAILAGFVNAARLTSPGDRPGFSDSTELTFVQGRLGRPP